MFGWGFWFFFFFSSRRRHTRWNCDWSSDVCSSDLDPERELQQRGDLGDRLEVVVAQVGDRALLGAERHLRGGGRGGAQQRLELEAGPEVPGPAAGERVRAHQARSGPLRLLTARFGHRGNTAWSSARSCGVSTSPTLVT